MNITLSDFNYKGHRFDRYVCELPNVKTLDDVLEERIIEYIRESLDEILKIKKRS